MHGTASGVCRPAPVAIPQLQRFPTSRCQVVDGRPVGIPRNHRFSSFLWHSSPNRQCSVNQSAWLPSTVPGGNASTCWPSYVRLRARVRQRPTHRRSSVRQTLFLALSHFSRDLFHILRLLLRGKSYILTLGVDWYFQWGIQWFLTGGKKAGGCLFDPQRVSAIPVQRDAVSTTGQEFSPTDVRHLLTGISPGRSGP